MEMYRVKTTVSNDGTLIIKGLPLRAGATVEVIIRGQEQQERHYSLRGKPIKYIEPFKGVAQDEWEAMQ